MLRWARSAVLALTSFSVCVAGVGILIDSAHPSPVFLLSFLVGAVAHRYFRQRSLGEDAQFFSVTTAKDSSDGHKAFYDAAVLGAVIVACLSAVFTSFS